MKLVKGYRMTENEESTDEFSITEKLNLFVLMFIDALTQNKFRYFT